MPNEIKEAGPILTKLCLSHGTKYKVPSTPRSDYYSTPIYWRNKALKLKTLNVLSRSTLRRCPI